MGPRQLMCTSGLDIPWSCTVYVYPMTGRPWWSPHQIFTNIHQSRIWPWSWYCVWSNFLLVVILITTHLVELKFIYQVSSHGSSAEISLCRRALSWPLLVTWIGDCLQTAWSRSLERNWLRESLVKRKKGPRTAPSGTSDGISAVSDLTQSRITCWLLCSEKESIHMSWFGSSPRRSSAYWGVLYWELCQKLWQGQQYDIYLLHH